MIDSQASRRAPGGGPGAANQPPRRQRRGRRRRGTYEEPAPLETKAPSGPAHVRVNSGSTVKDIAEYFDVPVPEIIKKLMALGEMATLTQTLSDDAIELLATEFGKTAEIVHAADDVDAEPSLRRRRPTRSSSVRRSSRSWATSTTARRRCWTRSATPR